MTIRSQLLGLAAASLFAVPAAQAASIKEVFEQNNLLGTWAQDCSKPADVNSNWYYVNRAIDDGHLQRDFMSGPDTRQWYAIFDKATEVVPGVIEMSGVITGRLFGGTHDGAPMVNAWFVQKNRMVPTIESIAGKTHVRGGKLIATGAEMPWLTKCGAQ